MAPPRKRRKTSNIAEITFDAAAREEYLTGFHKRKLQRKKHAQDQATKKEREDKIEARRRLRQQRKEDLEKHVQAINATLRGMTNEGIASGEDASDNDAEADSAEQWDGILEPVDISREDEYVDEDRYTTVTVENVDVSKDGLKPLSTRNGENSSGVGEGGGTIMDGVEGRMQEGHGNDKSRKKEKAAKDKPKKRKKKFRYESKADRKATLLKQTLKKRAMANARKAS